MVARTKAKTKARARTRPVKKAVKPQPRVSAEQPIMAALRAEHKHIARVMQVFAQQLDAVDAGTMVDTHIIYETMDYMVTWPDRFHHPREDLVYSRVAEVDAIAADNVDSLQREHDLMAVKGQKLLTAIEQWRQGSITGDSVVKEGRDYVEKMVEHMNVEEKLVFPQIESVLSLADWREIAVDEQLKPVMDPVFGGRVDREFRNLARKLRRSLRHTVEKGAMVEWVAIEALMESMEVMSMGYEAARDTTGDHLRTAWKESTGILRQAPLTGVFRCATNNTRLTVSWLENVFGISKDTLGDLARVNQQRRDRVRLLDRV